jgi:hypothetical protein
MWIILEVTIDLTHSARSLLPTTPRTLDLSPKLNNGWVISISRDTRLCYFCSYNAAENEAYFVLGSPMYNPIRDEFPSPLEKVVPGSIKSFFRLDQQVNSSLYLTGATALCHSRVLIGLKPSWCTSGPISLLGFMNFLINYIVVHFIKAMCKVQKTKPWV